MAADVLDTWFPELKALVEITAGPDSGKHKGEKDCFEHTMKVINKTPPIPEYRFASLCHDLDKCLSQAPPKHHGHEKAGLPLVLELCRRLKVPNKWKSSALLFTEHHLKMHRISEMRAGKAVKFITHLQRYFSQGVSGFLHCSIRDGMTAIEAGFIESLSKQIKAVKLPIKHRDKGKKCAEILLNERAAVWSRSKRNLAKYLTR